MATIVDIGRVLQRHGLDVGEHSQFGNGRVGRHSKNSHHYVDEAIDVRDWRPDNAPEFEGGNPLHWTLRTERLAGRAKQLGIFNEAFGPQDKNGHDTHTHLALRGRAERLRPEHKEWLATSRWKRPDGSYSFEMPSLESPLLAGPAAGRKPSATAGSRVAPLPAAPLQAEQPAAAESIRPAIEVAKSEPPAPPDWRPAASDPSRSTNPMDAAYWQREDMRQWAAANPKLAAPLLASAGVSLESMPAAAPPAGASGQLDYAGREFRPVDRGALSGIQISPAVHYNPEAKAGAEVDFAQALKVGLARANPVPVNYQGENYRRFQGL